MEALKNVVPGTVSESGKVVCQAGAMLIAARGPIINTLALSVSASNG
jgi:hypothetical protein